MSLTKNRLLQIKSGDCRPRRSFDAILDVGFAAVYIKEYQRHLFPWQLQSGF